ncbi:MAG: hypothetical protein HC915_08715 [Anaerolineae bacterium]|nr:hypothetical protein [Anaerolineae bacterium]
MRLTFSPRWQRPGILVLILYLAFIGGAAYPDTNFLLRLFHHLLMSGLLAGWVLGLTLEKRAWPRTPLDLPLLAYALWLVVALAASHDPRVSLEQSWTLAVHLLGFYWLVDLMQRGRSAGF